MRDGSRVAVATAIMMFVISVSAASAQSQVRVIKDRATIWHADAPIVAAMVSMGTVIDVLAREGEWYIVIIPPEVGGKGESGRIAVSQVETVPGSKPVPTRRPPPAATGHTAGQQASAGGARSDVSISGFGQVGYGTWLAHDTFNAVLGSSRLPMFGGGGRLRAREFFAEIAVERYQKDGQRVFVSNGEVFRLGIPTRVLIVPIFASIGYHFGPKNVSGYAGGGVGQYLYRETFAFSESSEERLDHFTSYHALAGVEFGGRSAFRAALEVQFTTVPDGLGAAGASAAFGERNLGGLQVRVKILAGR